VKGFLNPLIQNIVDIHPYFSSPYNLALLMSPNIHPDRPGYAEDKKLTESALIIGEK
jgi:hypothetical protein